MSARPYPCPAFRAAPAGRSRVGTRHHEHRDGPDQGRPPARSARRSRGDRGALLTGCGGGADAGSASDGEASPTPSPAPSPSPTEEEGPEPADGTDLASCSDAECEVRVSQGDEIDLGGYTGIDELVVATVEPWKVTFSLYGPGIQFGGSQEAPFTEMSANRFNGVAVHVLGADEEGAVLHISKA
ncbi:hypothetical protein HNR12_003021 [Streptomonospora nanhaiensis]|uniref:Uncharacterized protein n=1 Tax=Streptomonospora nanhaiensis TaxID=1323731 RepID=A0A853BPN3_9ACTN|nr:hypothetical protein [Streptomonospora nanhaiensis]NYI96744.1 hypothetical protein [Streptomonospora nanhaiensis]